MIKTVFQTLILCLLLSASLAHADGTPSYCAPLTNLEQKRWKDLLKWDVPQMLTQNLKDIHFEIRSTDEDDVIRRRQMRAMSLAFDFGTWALRLSNNAGVSQKQMEYLFGAWIKDRYLGSVLRTIRKDEIVTIQKNPRSFPTSTLERIHQYPVEPLITKINNFQCVTQEDSKTYRCGDKMLTIEAQLSPQVLCSQQNAWSEYRIKFFVRIDPIFGPLIFDVERMHRRIYQTAFLDLEKLKAETPPQELLALFTQWTFSTIKEVRDIPSEGLTALRPATATPIAPATITPAAGRIPASTPKR